MQCSDFRETIFTKTRSMVIDVDFINNGNLGDFIYLNKILFLEN
jgi:hypothetical protein